MHRAAQRVRSDMRLPAKSGTDGQARRRFPGVLNVERGEILSRIRERRISLDETRSLAQHEVRQSHSREVPVENRIRNARDTGAAVETFMNQASAGADLMRAAHHAEIVPQMI